MSDQQTSSPIDWSDEQYRQFGLVPQITPHGYHELSLFRTETLIALLDEYPRRHLQAYSMGTDPENNSDWRQVDIAEGTSGADLWRAVETGRIWLNLVHIEENRAEYRELIDAMYAHLGEHCPHLQNPKGTHSALLISSPGAQVYYHLDAEPNMLWHLRGQKDVWLYPAMDLELVPQDYLEDIYAGEIGENLPYKAAFDQQAMHCRLQPGDAASWPHNGPHRIVNVDMNVSLATSYYTPVVYRRQYVQLANRFILRNLGIRNRSMAEEGVVPAVKRMSYRILNRIRPFRRRERSASYITDLQLDPDAPLSLRKLSEPRLASFARKSAADGGQAV
ncbi:hypothetical protein ACUNV4_12680 [Granulosicoccus sp. 3-233]|uniref:hypothetical protein n=1 Tax=Granulosicoccus sp. 3-233 TaxID=3417969 RepID=UPI003D3411E3